MITPPQSPSLGSTDGDERVVRFDNECVLIPESVLCSKRPKVFTKSYSLPLWKRKPAPDTDVSYAESGTNEENQVVFKMPVPSFMSKSSRFPTRVTEAQPLLPCLVHSKSASPSRPAQSRRVSLPISPRADVVTIPLRSCCENCLHITEECLKEGVEWQEKFSRAARRRRRSSSLDSTGFVGITPSEASSNFSAKLGLNVDEVDRRRHSHEVKEQEMESSVSSDNSEDEPRSSKETPRVSPIAEEDDDQLFPLPSPRRTPTSSPLPSPNTSTFCLGASSSRDSLPNSVASSDESASRVRKTRCEKGMLTPDASPSIPPRVPPSMQQEGSLFQNTKPMLPIPVPTRPPPSSFTRTPSSSPDRKRRRPSFTLPKPTQFLKAGADAIKGVGAISNGSPIHI
ncbi:hypothetical protein PILCRDRAFT_821178 [Piloderma croceum F 1598]|uniref:Uncharacterized protein n=1 Tax=Piloderma croceum (strain F 1598) TaxID=765440 RepID=A0A0C3BWT4_PILCF|nr:hypothetical protein PILCRDRAFT_821178 [Piloderma croceum F 1598]